MLLWHRRLPTRERYALPPREITERVTQAAGIARYLDKTQRRELSVAAHFAYGTTMGLLYAPLSRKLKAHPLVGGMTFGLLVWTASYFGLLPALGILRPANEHPARRNALMIVAHLVWGAVMATLTQRLESDHVED